MLPFIIFLILLIFGSIIYITFKLLNKPYDLFTNCENYRIGDVFYNRIQNKKKKDSSQKTKKEIYDLILNNYPDSICSNYILKHQKVYDYNTLFKIINEKTKKYNINKHSVILHLRTGDILDDPFYDNNKKLIDNKIFNNDPSDDSNDFPSIKVKYNNKIYDRIKNPNIYLKSINFYKKIIEKLKKMNIKDILIISGTHVKCENYKLSSYVINKVKKLFENNNFKVKLNLGNHPDIDLMKVLNSNYFIPSNGGYSELLENLAKIKKIIILN